MTCEKDVGESVSKFTIASLIDIGYANVDLSPFDDPKLARDGWILVRKLIDLVK